MQSWVEEERCNFHKHHLNICINLSNMFKNWIKLRSTWTWVAQEHLELKARPLRLLKWRKVSIIDEFGDQAARALMT